MKGIERVSRLERNEVARSDFRSKESLEGGVSERLVKQRFRRTGSMMISIS